MSALAGIVRLDGQPVTPREVDVMSDALTHRGSSAGAWVEGSVGLACRSRDSASPRPTGRVPALAAGPIVCAADARLDYRDELLRALDRRPTESVEDVPLLLAAYERWGADAPDRVLGDFAAAIWDGRSRSLICFRDRAGVRPFYYAHIPGRLFAFASEIKALLTILPPDIRRLNEARIADYLESVLHETEETFFAGIRRLPPAHVIRIDMPPAGISIRRYWSLDPSRSPQRRRSDADTIAAFRATFFEAVATRIRGTGPVGSTLSGGLDSSAVACTVRQLLGGTDRALHTFSIVFDSVTECDEREYIDAVLALGGFTPHRIVGDAITPFTDLRATLEHQDEPFYAPNLFLHQAMYRAAQRAGVVRFLDGLDGDTTVSHGLTWLGELATQGRVLALAAELRALARRYPDATWPLIRRHVVRALIPDPVRRWRQQRRSARTAVGAASVLRPEFASRIAWQDRRARLAIGEREALRSERDEHYRRLTWGLLPFVLEVADREASRAGIEPVYPFFDSRLLELSLDVPPHLKLHDGWTRYVLRRALDGVLPPAIQWRAGKSNLAPNFRHALAAAPETAIAPLLADSRGPLADYVDLRAAAAAYDRVRQRATDTDAMTVWKVTTLGVWLRDTGVAA